MNSPDLLSARILLVDDQEANLRLLEDLLTQEGFSNIVSTTAPESALNLFQVFDPDLIILDLMMPGLSGYSVLEQLSRHSEKLDFRPVLVITADATQEAKRRALALGAKDFLTKPFDAIEAMLRVWNLIETRFLYRQLRQIDRQSSDAWSEAAQIQRPN